MSSFYFASCGFFLLLMMLILAMECSRVSSARHVLDPREEARLPVPKGNLTISVNENFFNKAMFLLLPWLNVFLRGLKIPAHEEGDLYFDEINFTEIGVGSVSVAMESPNRLNVSLYDLKVAIPETFFSVWVGLFWCNGILRFSVRILTIKVSLMVFLQPNGKVGLKNLGVEILWLKLFVEHSFTGGFCSGMEKVIEALFGDLDKIIELMAMKKVPAMIGSMLEEKSDAFFNSLPFHVVDGPNVSEKRLEIAMNSDSRSEKSEEVSSLLLPVISSPWMPSNLDSPPWRRNLEVFFTESAFNDILLCLNRSFHLNKTVAFPPKYNSSLIKKMFPELYKLCPNCSFVALFSPTVPPRAIFRPYRTVIFDILNGFVGLRMVSAAGQQVPVLETLVNYTGGFSDLRVTLLHSIYFRLTEANVTLKVLKTSVGPIDEKALNEKVRFLLKWVLLPMFNVDFRGIPLPPQIEWPFLDVSPQGIMAAFDLSIL
ncbi:putative expression site-associated gene (ESAG) protein [Trypanosoma cruzi]|uniref:Putative expression site-associated gene (ESAG) protein n=1 Tax=Trypanosoma cruzi TaxID=5693 RepID=A0A2V2VBD5_TRYCR|nr:putative expression site-associated gene (ESAG) protein [Trypanosoma cruzi]